MLLGISTMLALRTGIEEFQVGEDEMSAWLGAAQKVARHYSVETTQKTLDWVAFVGITGQVFGTRAVAISVKSRQSKAPKQNAGATIMPFGNANFTVHEGSGAPLGGEV
jgi:hypothetical protein